MTPEDTIRQALAGLPLRDGQAALEALGALIGQRDRARLDADLNLDLYRQARDRWLREPQEEKA